MALLQVNFHSRALKRITAFNALMPIDRPDIPDQAEDPRETRKVEQILYNDSTFLFFKQWGYITGLPFQI
ncbi:hypothetical protein DFR58_101210 [Anaerobacterium chartisolvens]|uniref:Uncharacterized protein n=1 Tax=Anaerobacterium chartisolvens TaxID=1297424 RepID=A0A369BKA2_9FIRM|nr:hypothetical protein [Anaerobacterium chartisolvens]RCX21006.1 hypothetical protein DFR58_101210 [Anaerobacterium chartisolvens]